MNERAPNQNERKEGDPETELAAIGSRIVQHRNACGWRQAELARRTGIPSTRLSRLERGRIPRLDELVRIGRALGVRLDDLVFGERPESRLERVAGELESVGEPAELDVVGTVLEALAVGFKTLRRGGAARRGEGASC
jgi:transcriptional regulator with XRE-family HTH domain